MNGQELAEGVWGFETHGIVNWYLVEDGDGLTAIDAGLNDSWNEFQDWTRAHGRSIKDLDAIVLTHAHVDHFGFSARAQEQAGAKIYAHPGEDPLVRHPLRPQRSERLPIFYMNHLSTWKTILGVVAGGLRTHGVDDYEQVQDGQILESVPGKPRVIFTPGHTQGHCAVHMSDRDVLFPGDAWVTRDPYTGKTGPRLVARSATNDVERNLKSLEALEKIDAGLALTGHGPPWRRSAAEGARLARQAGAA